VTERVLGPAATALACLLFVAAFQLQTAPLSPQSLANRHFANTADYTTAISELKRVWPPLYPSVLWAGEAVGVPLHLANALLFFLTLAVLYPVGRRVAPEVNPAWAIALYAAAGFNAFNLHQLVAEALLIPLALGVLAYTARCVEHGRDRDYACLCALLAACCLTRYFALAWLVPLVGLTLALRGVRSTRARVMRAAAVVAVACGPAALWMLHARATTGFFTGMERFAPRGFEAQTSLLGNVSHIARTFFLDFFAPRFDASHASLAGGSADPLALAVAAGALSLGVWCAVVAIRSEAPDAGNTSGALSLVLPGLSVGYVAVLLLVWTVGNNDPIHSRFLYPSYVFFLLGGMHLYSHVKTSHTDTRGAATRPFQALYALLLATQAGGTLLAIGSAGGGA
jgi:hypothetical protein